MYEEEMGLRPGQVETRWVQSGPERFGIKHLLIKLFIQTDEEAAGSGLDRRAMLTLLEGTEYHHNGLLGVYKNVGDCKYAPREYAVTTILIRAQKDIVTLDGDWDYNLIVEMGVK